MKREDKVISFELAKKLHELGVKVESERWWGVKDNNATQGMIGEWHLIPCGYTKNWVMYPAYDTAELGEMLPYRTRLEDDDYWLRIFKLKHGDFELRYTSTKPSLSGLMGQDLSGIIQAKTEAEARGKMLSWLIENNYVKGEEL